MQNNNIIITEWMSPDERYVIFLDELYDIEKKVKIGDIWENFDNLKFFLRYSFNISDVDMVLKEQVNNILNFTLITESTKDVLLYKQQIKDYLSENVLSDFKSWAKDTGKSTVSGFKEFLSKTQSGAKQLVDKISNADWVKVVDLLGKGIGFFAKKLRDALYHPVGVVLDTILVASGIGKGVQWIPWAIVVALDMVELINGDYDSLSSHLFSTFFDVLGLVFTGAVAKGVKLTFKGIKKTSDANKLILTNPTVKKYFTKIPEILSKVSPKLSQAAKFLSNKFPKASEFINNVLGKLDVAINKMTTEFNKILKPSVGVAAGVTTGISAGLGTYGKGQERKDKENVTITPEDIENIPDMDMTGLF
jgi:hypothetical protein